MRTSATFFFIFVAGMGFDVSTAKAGGCETLKSSREIIGCVIESHPYIVREKSRLKQGNALGEIALEIPNPEFESRLSYSDNATLGSFSSEVAILQPFELGGKRSARELKAKADKLLLAAEAISVEEQVVMAALVDLHRLRQLGEEQARLDEALHTYERIVRQYRIRGRLTPEQEVSLSVFRIAISDLKMRKGLLAADVADRQLSLQFAVGKRIEFSDSLLPPGKIEWPAIEEVSGQNEVVGSEVLRSQAALALAGAELSLAQANAWPDLRLGPLFQASGQGAGRVSSLGVALAMPLPLFNRNAGLRTYSRAGIEMAGRSYEAVRANVNQRRASLVSRYRNSLEALRESDLQRLDREHARWDSLFERGVIPSALVIESHRQVLDFVRSHHQQQLVTLEALWGVYALDGTLIEKIQAL